MRQNKWSNASCEFVSMQSRFPKRFSLGFCGAENRQWRPTSYQLSDVTNFYYYHNVRKCSCIYLSLVHFNTIFSLLIFIEISRKQNISTFFLKTESAQIWKSKTMSISFCANEMNLQQCVQSYMGNATDAVVTICEMLFNIIILWASSHTRMRIENVVCCTYKWNEISKRSNIGTLSDFHPPTNQFTLCRLLTHSFARSLHFPSTFCIIYYSEDITASCFEFS